MTASPADMPALVIASDPPAGDAYDGRREPAALKVFPTWPGDRTVRIGIRGQSGRREEFTLGPTDLQRVVDALDARLDLIDGGVGS